MRDIIAAFITCLYTFVAGAQVMAVQNDRKNVTPAIEKCPVSSGLKIAEVAGCGHTLALSGCGSILI